MASAQSTAEASASPVSRSAFARLPVQALVLVACSLLPYVGTWSYGFVDYDDPLTIIHFEPIRELSLAHVLALFRPELYPGLPEYMPLKNVSYALDYALFGLWAPGYRIQQQFWYALDVLLLWAWLRAVLHATAARAPLGPSEAWSAALAWITAALFALHPVHVESVTWLSGRKDLMCGAFMAWAMWSALRYEPTRGRGALWACFAATALALLSKPMAVVLPLLLLLADVFVSARGELGARLRARWTLHTGVAAMCASFAVFYQRFVGVLASHTLDTWRQYDGPAFARWGQQLQAFLTLALFPRELAPVMPPELLDASATSPDALLGYALLALLVLGGGVLLWRRHVLGLAAGLFAIPLAPIIASPAWGQFVAPRYAYLAVVGPLIALAWTGMWLAAHKPVARRAMSLAGLVVALALGTTTVEYNSRWRDGLSLWLHSIEVYPRFTMYYERAARLAFESGQTELGMEILRQCVRIEPTHAGCLATLGGLLSRDDPKQAERLLRAALHDDPVGTAHLQLARVMARTGRGHEGMELYLGWLRGKAVGVRQVEPLAWIAIDVGDAERARFAVRHTIGAAAVNEPAGAPPRALLEALAKLPGTAPTLAAAIDDALQRCSRNDCVKQALGW